jgi:capsular polysaccharide biosynthesis protein
MKSEYGVSGIQRLRQKLIPDSPRRRLYITRAQNRKIINDDEVSFLLKSRRFERWEDTQLIGMSLPEQAAFFHSAEAIVSPQGSHLCNSFFCRPDVTLVELFKFSWIEASPLCALRAATLNARFGFTVDWAPWETYDQPLIHADIRVDLNKLEVLLNDLN